MADGLLTEKYSIDGCIVRVSISRAVKIHMCHVDVCSIKSINKQSA